MVRQNKSKANAGRRVYDLKVDILDGRVTKKYVGANPVVSRTIRIRGDQTLETLHEAIFDAFDRFDAHMYEFQLGAKRAHDPKARRYVMSVMENDMFGAGVAAGVVERTEIDDMGLRLHQQFLYWFDFGDDWWHGITVVAIGEADGGSYPRVTAKVGASPPQYADLDDEDADEDECEDEEE
jgi:hypothetical protein